MPKLLYIKDDIVIKEYPLVEGDFSIGRNPGNNLQMDDGTVSGEHAVLHIKPSPYMDGLLDVVIEDCGSTNGTRINGRKIDRHRMKHNEMIQVGSHQLRFFDEQTQPYDSTRIFLPEDPDESTS